MKYPKILAKHIQTLSGLKDSVIEAKVKEIVTNDMTIEMLVGNVTNALLKSNNCIATVNVHDYNFKKALILRVNNVVKNINFNLTKQTHTSIDKNGTMYTYTVNYITGERSKKDQPKVWFYEADSFIDYAEMKGSFVKFDNNSTELLSRRLEVPLRVKEIAPKFVKLYSAILYMDTKNADRTEALSSYRKRLEAVADETISCMGYEYENYRKLDSNTRNYPLSRFGFAVEYGDAFEKFLIEPAQEYLVDKTEVKYAKQYLKAEFNVTSIKTLVKEAETKLKVNLKLLKLFNQGKKVDFTITHKEVGKLLHIVDVYYNIIKNEGNMTRSCVSYDYTNSGGINASNQFGDEQFCKAMNLLGGKEKFDTHQAIADYLGISRDDAKKVMQGPNHGGRVPANLTDMVTTVFGDNYKYIGKIAMYGKKLALAGVNSVVLERLDGIKAVWYPYVLGAEVSTEDGATVTAEMPFLYNVQAKDHKALGLAVSCLHSQDAFTENYVFTKLLDKHNIHMKTTLDNFYGRPSIKPLLIKYTFEALELAKGHIERQLQDIEKQTGISREWTLPTRTATLVPSENII